MARYLGSSFVYGVKMKTIIFFALLLGGLSQAQTVNLEVSSPLYDFAYLSGLKPPTQYPVTFSEGDFEAKPWMKEFEWVIVVNKATAGDDRQSLRIYRHQRLIGTNEILQDIQSHPKDLSWHIKDLSKRTWAPGVFKVSTGRDEFEAAGNHGAQRDNYTITPSGYFVPQYFTKKHKSEAYSSRSCGGDPVVIYGERIEGTFWARRRVRYVQQVLKPAKCIYMEDVVFFNGGIGLHRAISGTESNLGTKASGGCVRLPGVISTYLFKNLQAAKSSVDLPLVNQDGTVALDEAGNIIRTARNESVWGELDTRSVLIIVHETVRTIPKSLIPRPRPFKP